MNQSRRGERIGEYRSYIAGGAPVSLQIFGRAAELAGNVKKIVATRLQKIPIAQAMPRPLSEGLCAQPNEPNPLTAVRPARITGLITPATSCSSSRVFCHTRTT